MNAESRLVRRVTQEGSFYHLNDREVGPFEHDDSPLVQLEISRALDVAVDDVARIHRVTLEEVHTRFQRWLYVEDTDLIDVLLAAASDRKVAGDPVWIMLIAASGGLKSETLRACMSLPSVMEIDNLTSRSIVSGKTNAEGEVLKGLASEADGKVLIMKDFTELLSKERTERAEIISQFRTWYDGTVSRRYGTQDKIVKVHSRIGLIVGVTPAVDLYTSMLGVLGDRFLKFRYHQSREKSVEYARKYRGREEEMRLELRGVVNAFMEQLKFDQATSVPPDIEDGITALAELTALARTCLPRGLGDFGVVTYDPEPEYATRLIKQLLKLASMLAVVRGKAEVTADEFRVIARIAEDSCAPHRLGIFRVMFNRSLTGYEVSIATGLPRGTVYRILGELEILRFATAEEIIEGDNKVTRYTLTLLIEKALVAVYGKDAEGHLGPSALVHPFLQTYAKAKEGYPETPIPSKNPWTIEPPPEQAAIQIETMRHLTTTAWQRDHPKEAPNSNDSNDTMTLHDSKPSMILHDQTGGYAHPGVVSPLQRIPDERERSLK
jgi:hypothetical protein